jgi:transcriptional regulator with XRE-family HTH domain
MPAEIRTPFTRSAAQQTAVPGVWRKKVLPVGQVEYNGAMLNFDYDYLKTLAESFNASAYDQVPFQLADAKNTHTNDPERFRGEILAVDAKPDGLWVTLKPTPAGNKLLMTNPKLGVSARIVEQYERSDGQHFPAAIQHVLGTLDPRIPGLGAWEAVEMSSVNAPEMIIDLSAATFAGEEGGGTMPELDAEKQARLAALLDLDPDSFNALLEQLGGAEPDEADLNDDDIVAAIGSLTDEEFAALAAEYELDDEPQPVGAGASLSNGYNGYNGYGMSDIELANVQLAETQRQMSVLQREHDREAFENEKRRLAAKSNVPPWITELARPLLEGTGRTVELANGDFTDAGLIMRKVLTAFGGALDGLGLESPIELGSSMDFEPDTSARAEQERSSLVSRVRSQTGI